MKENKISSNENYLRYKDRLDHDLDIIIESESENNQSNTPLRTKELIIQEGYFAGEIGYDEDSNKEVYIDYIFKSNSPIEINYG